MKAIILLSFVAIALATPIAIDEKRHSSTNPDISTLPLQKNANNGSENFSAQGGVQAHPLHKRDTSKITDGKTNNNVQKSPTTSANPTAPRTTQINSQPPTLSQSSRVKRDAPKSVDQKATTLNKKPDTTSQHSDLPKASTQGSRITRDAPKNVDQKATTLNKKPETTSQHSDLPKASQQGSRTKRDAPKQSSDLKSTVQSSKLLTNPTDNKSDLKSTKDETSSTTAVKSGSQIVQKRESPAGNVREPLQSSSSSNNNQSPSFIHPVPVDQILTKKDVIKVETTSIPTNSESKQ